MVGGRLLRLLPPRGLPARPDAPAVPTAARVAEAAFAAALLAVGLFTFPLWVMGADLRSLPGDPLDARFNNYVLEHGHRYLTGREPSFWTAPCFYPVPQTTALSDSHIGTVPIYSAFRLAGCDRETAFQLWWVAICVLNFAAGHLVLRGFGFGPVPAAVGAYVFTFGLPLLYFVPHLQVYPRAGVPLACYWGWRFLTTGRTRYWLGLGLAAVWQLYATVYVGYFLGLALAGFFLAGAVVYRREVLQYIVCAGWRTQLARAVVAVGCAAAAWPLVQAHREVARPDLLEQNLKDIARTMPRPVSWVLPPTHGDVWCRPDTPDLPAGEGYVRLFFGAVPFLGLALVLLPGRWAGGAVLRRVALLAVGAAAVPVLLTLNLGDDSPYWLLTKLPGVAAIRAVFRVVVVIAFPAAVLAAYALAAVDRLAGRLPRPLALTAMLAAVVFAVAEQQARHAGWAFDKAESRDRVARLADRMRATPGAHSVVVLTPFDDAYRYCVVQVDAMQAAQSVGLPCVNGYSGHDPEGWILPTAPGEVVRWKLFAADRYGWYRPGKIPYYHRHGFDGLLVIDGDEQYTLGPATRQAGPLPDPDCRAGFEYLAGPGRWAAGRRGRVAVRVTNPTGQTWSAVGRPVPNEPNFFGYHQVFVTHRWLDADGREVEGLNDHPRTHFREDVPPGGSQRVVLTPTAPRAPGRYVLEVTMGQEFRGWFHDIAGNPTLKVPVEVTP